jgi:hypothetical protein
MTQSIALWSSVVTEAKGSPASLVNCSERNGNCIVGIWMISQGGGTPKPAASFLHLMNVDDGHKKTRVQETCAVTQREIITVSLMLVLHTCKRRINHRVCCGCAPLRVGSSVADWIALASKTWGASW